MIFIKNADCRIYGLIVLVFRRQFQTFYHSLSQAFVLVYAILIVPFQLIEGSHAMEEWALYSQLFETSWIFP